MESTKRNKVIYWVLTILVIAPTGGSGIPELFFHGPATAVQSMHALGYPPYVLKILGFAKIMGALAILYGRFPKLKEWAYAGFTFDFLGATASHLLAKDYGHAPIPLVLWGLLMGSYVFWNRTRGAMVGS